MIERILDVVAARGALRILRSLGEKGLRFNEILNTVGNPKTLSKRLRDLSTHGLVEKRGNRYVVTETGRQVLSSISQLAAKLSSSQWLKMEGLEKIPYRELRDLLGRYCELLMDRYNDDLVSIIVFGSMTRGEAKPNESDVDVLVVVDGWEELGVWDRIGQLVEVEDRLRRTVEFKELVERGVYPIIQNYPLSASEGREFHSIYLDMVFDRAILYDRMGFMAQVLERLRGRLSDEGARRVSLPNGSWYWILKPDLKAGEVVDLE